MKKYDSEATHEKMRRFAVLLRQRGLTQAKLARQIHTDPGHLSKVLRGAPGRGGQTRRKLLKMLTDPEVAALGWERGMTRGKCSTGNKRDNGNANDHVNSRIQTSSSEP